MPSPEEMAATMIANMPEKTGKPLEEWLALAKASGAGKHGEIVKHLKGEHGLSHGYANLVAQKMLNPEPDTPAALVDAQYSGPKADLRPIYDVLVAYITGLGRDVEIAPKKSSVSFRRGKQFALVVPASKTRVDLGINLKGDPARGRLEAWDTMISHRVRLGSTADVDADVKDWLKQAYERS